MSANWPSDLTVRIQTQLVSSGPSHLTLYSPETTVTEEVATINTSGSHWLVGKIYPEVG